MDLTVPYAESGFSMVVPIKDTKRNLQGISEAIDMGPLVDKLFLRVICCISFSIWLFECRINENSEALLYIKLARFSGSPSQQ